MVIIEELGWIQFFDSRQFGLFLYGMRTMSDGIQKVAGERLQSV